MRNFLVLMISTSLAACGGGGVQTAGSGLTGSASPTPATPTPATPSVPGSGHSFVNPTETRSYSGIGAVHSYAYSTNDIDGDPATPGTQSAQQQYGQFYAGEAATARNSGINITYNPRDAIFDIIMKEPKAKIDNTLRFQDPAHRTDFGGATEPQTGTPNITSQNVRFLQTSEAFGTLVYDPAQSDIFPILTDGSNVSRSTFFYQKPGTVTNYVTFAGFVRNKTAVALVRPIGLPNYFEQVHKLERGAFVFGERTGNSDVPVSGTGTFNGSMLASIVYNPLLDTDAKTPTYFQWITGTASTTVNFAANTFTMSTTGTVTAPGFDIYTSRVFSLPAGSTFNANGSGRVDIIGQGGFLGSFANAWFTTPANTRLDVAIAGSSIDGAFFGPVAQEVGGSFRIVGGNPDERIDILGAFTGKK